jgi:Helicase associated domain
MLTDQTALVLAKAGLDLTHPWFRAYLQGTPPRVIAAEHNAHPNAVHNVLRRYIKIAPQIKFLHESLLQSPEAKNRFAVTAAWTAKYEATANHYARTGQLPRVRDKDPGVAALGRWVSKQRSLAVRQLLGDDQLALLAKMPGWNTP